MEIALTQPRCWTDPDTDLVRRMAAGDEEALRVLYATYGRRLYAYACRLTGSLTMAEEVLQDSLLAAWKGAGAFRGEARALTWLLGIVHRQALNATRRKSWPVTALEEAATVADGRVTPEGQVEATERYQALQVALSRLSPEHREVIVLREIDGCEYQEIAERIGIPLGSVMSRLFYARKKLQTMLRDVYENL